MASRNEYLGNAANEAAGSGITVKLPIPAGDTSNAMLARVF
jgi:hypothetical protein